MRTFLPKQTARDARNGPLEFQQASQQAQKIVPSTSKALSALFFLVENPGQDKLYRKNFDLYYPTGSVISDNLEHKVQRRRGDNKTNKEILRQHFV